MRRAGAREWPRQVTDLTEPPYRHSQSIPVARPSAFSKSGLHAGRLGARYHLSTTLLLPPGNLASVVLQREPCTQPELRITWECSSCGPRERAPGPAHRRSWGPKRPSARKTAETTSTAPASAGTGHMSQFLLYISRAGSSPRTYCSCSLHLKLLQCLRPRLHAD